MSNTECNFYTSQWDPQEKVTQDTPYMTYLDEIYPLLNKEDISELEKKALTLIEERVQETPISFQEEGLAIGALLDEKNKAYGSAFDKCADFIKLLYPKGIPNNTESYTDMLCLIRIFDKMMRIATSKDAFNESPFSDIAGYAILGLRRHKQR